MSAVFGFRSSSSADTLAIMGALGSADQIHSQEFDTLAQYQIKDAKLQPANFSFGMPRQWNLVLNTSIRGFNRPSGQAVYFPSNEDSTHGSGYLTYPLNTKEFSQMLNGGLYTNPEGYMKRLTSGLSKHQFYRKSRVSLTTARVDQTMLPVKAGEFTAKPTNSNTREFLIGTDLESYYNFVPESASQSNLPALLQQTTADLVADPVVSKRELVKADPSRRILLAQTPTPETEKDKAPASLALSAQSDIVREAPFSAESSHQSFSELASAAMQSDAAATTKEPANDASSTASQPEKPAPTSESDAKTEAQKPTNSGKDDHNPDKVASAPITLDDMMQSLTDMQAKRQTSTDPTDTTEKPVYVDDFAQANQDSHAARQKKQQKRQAQIRQQRQEDARKSAKDQSADDGLSL